MIPRILEVRQRILKRNDEVARALRARFESAGVLVVSLVSSPGAGKTELLARTMRELSKSLRVAAIVGDLATDNDARRLAASGAPARQINTGATCHLEAEMVEHAIADWDLSQLDLLFVENVGNLVCPAAFDLGEAVRVLLISVTEGEDKPLKYPTLINTADIVLITKLDLAAAADFDEVELRTNIALARPGAQVMGLSAKTGIGMSAWLDELRLRNHATRGEVSSDNRSVVRLHAN